MKRYMILGFAMVFALSLTVPALGGPSNPVATSAVSLTKVLKKAKAAKAAADAAQATANSAQSSASTAQSTANAAQTAAAGAQTTANNALAETADVSADDLDMVLDTQGGPSDSDSSKITASTCPAGTEPVSINGNVGLGLGSQPEEVDLDGEAWYLSEYAIAHEETAFAGNWVLTVQAVCIDSSG